MSFFAGFVEGVFRGKDWREAREDRKRLRAQDDERFGWEREDRGWTGEARDRQRQIWSQDDEDRARDQRERADAEARQSRIEDSRRQALGVLDAGEDERPLPPAGATTPEVEAPARSDTQPQDRRRGAISLMGLGRPGVGTEGAPTGQTGAAPRADGGFVLGTPVPGTQERTPPPPPAAEPASVPVARGQTGATPDPALVARGAEIAGIEPYTPGQPRGFNLRDMLVSPAAASTMPDEGQRARGNPPGQATQDALQGRGEGFSDYTEVTRGFRSDAPLRGAAQQQPPRTTADTDRPAPSEAAQRRAESVRDTVRNAFPDQDPIARATGWINRRGMNVAGAASDIAGSGLSAVGATDAGARMYDRGDAARSEASRQDAQAAEGRAPRPAREAPGTPPPAAPDRRRAATPAEARAGAAPSGELSFNLGEDAMRLTPPRRVMTGTVADVAAEVAGAFGADTGSFKAAGDAIAKSPGMSVTSATGDTPAPKRSEVLAVSREAARRFPREEVDRHARLLESKGLFDEARAWREYAQSENTRKAMERFAAAMTYWSMNDEGNALQAVVDLYNMPGYYDDGLSVLKEGTAFHYDEGGNINGLSVTFRDESTGDTFQQTIRGPGDKVMAVVLGALSPEATFQAAWEATGGAAGAQQATPQLTPELMLRIDAEARKQAEMDMGQSRPTPEAIEAAKRRIMRDMGFPDGSEVPLME